MNYTTGVKGHDLVKEYKNFKLDIPELEIPGAYFTDKSLTKQLRELGLIADKAEGKAAQHVDLIPVYMIPVLMSSVKCRKSGLIRDRGTYYR